MLLYSSRQRAFAILLEESMGKGVLVPHILSYNSPCGELLACGSVCVCMCMYIYIYIYLYIYTHIYLFIYLFSSLCFDLFIYLYLYIYLFIAAFPVGHGCILGLYPGGYAGTATRRRTFQGYAVMAGSPSLISALLERKADCNDRISKHKKDCPLQSCCIPGQGCPWPLAA